MVTAHPKSLQETPSRTRARPASTFTFTIILRALVSTGDLYTFDGPSRQLRNLRQSTGFTLLSSRPNPSGLVTGDSAGTGHFLRYANNNYTENLTLQLSSASLDGISVLSNGALWTGSAGLLSLRLPPSYSSVTWQSPAIGSGFGRFVATDVRYGQKRVFSSAQHAVVGLIYAHLAPPVGDFNHDGHPDYVLFNPSTRRTAIWYLNGASYSGSVYGPTLPVGWTVACVADLNLDGKPDYVLFNASTRRTAIWFLNNNVYTGSVYGPTLPVGWTLIAATDFNHDGHLDYVLFNPSTRRTTIWYLNGTAYTSFAYGPTLPSGWTLQGSADFNGDGQPDYVLYQASTRRTELWYLNGAAYVSSAFGPTLAAGYILASP